MIQHYRRQDAGADPQKSGDAPRWVCGRLEKPEITIDPPLTPQDIQEEDCRNCVRRIQETWEKKHKTEAPPIRHIRKERDLPSTICGKNTLGMNPPALPYPEQLPTPGPGWCQMCRNLWERQEKYRQEKYRQEKARAQGAG